MSSLTELREKVERAVGPDRELDLSIYALLDPAEPSLALHKLNRLPAITASIDAALALVETKLPGWSHHIHLHPDEAHVDLYKLGDLVTQNDQLYRPVVMGPFDAGPLPTLPLAILSALLRALESQEQAGG